MSENTSSHEHANADYPAQVSHYPSKWSTHYARTANLPAWHLTKKAVEKIPYKKGMHARDLGCGTGRDTKFLVKQGFHVTSVDNNTKAIRCIETFKKVYGLTDTQLTTTQSTFDTFSFEKEKYDSVNASFSLPFNPPKTFDQTFSRMKNSIQKGGLFTGQLFGKEDEWSTTRKGHMTFHSSEEARTLFSDMKLIHFEEVKERKRSDDGKPKNWHYFHIIAQK